MSSSEAEFDDGGSDDDIPIGNLSTKATAVVTPASVTSSSTSSMSIPKKKKNSAAGRKRLVPVKAKEEGEISDGEVDKDGEIDEDFQPSPPPPKKKTPANKSATNGSARKKVAPASKSKPRAKVKKEAGLSPRRKASSAAAKGKKELKKMEKANRLHHGMQAFLWWDAPDPPPGQQYMTMEHAGVSLPEPYVPHRVKMLYDGRELDLTPAEEEAATFFVATDPEGMHLGNEVTRPIFEKNFFEDFHEVLSKKQKKITRTFKKCDFVYRKALPAVPVQDQALGSYLG